MHESDIDKVYAIETTVHITPWSRTILRDCVLVGYNCLVLETRMNDDWVLSGYMICRRRDHVCHILNFCIAKELQSQGYGRKFLEHVLDLLNKSNDSYSVMLEVRPSNAAALHLYKSLGFDEVEIKKDYYKDNDKVEDAILLMKFLRV